jgi:hypothetical protein
MLVLTVLEYKKFSLEFIDIKIYSEIFLINNCQCQNEVKNYTVPP